MSSVSDSNVPPLRLRAVNDAPVQSDGAYVLYWMIAARRAQSNYGLDRAIEWANELGRPLVVFEPLRVGYQWASDRFHQFVIEGMADNQAALKGSPAHYYPYVEPRAGAGKGLLDALASRSCVVVTDDPSAYFLPRMIEAAGKGLLALGSPVKLEAVDSNGILPTRAPDKVFARAYDFRRYLQREVRPYLSLAPDSRPFDSLAGRGSDATEGVISQDVLKQWPPADPSELLASGGLDALPIDHDVPPVPYRGGAVAGKETLHRFVSNGLDRYGDRNQPELDVASGLSPYLHFGHVSSHEVLQAVADHEEWKPNHVAATTDGGRSGWWGMSKAAEGFMDQLVTWRELGHNFCSRRSDYSEFESLPEWARDTLSDHARDARDHVYTLEEFESARTHDELWNAAQNQLRQEGRIHNYLRMLWGKKILHWSRSPREALEIMIELNDKYAVDGRDPNSYSGIMWTLGRYDRPWGPEREIFGKIRYMTSASTRRKLRVTGYIERWNSQQASLGV